MQPIRIRSVTDGLVLLSVVAASVYGQIWANPNNPQAERSVRFPPGSIVVKIVFTTATNEQVPSMKGSPEWYAVRSTSFNAL
jgi:hypothetical protein